MLLLVEFSIADRSRLNMAEKTNVTITILADQKAEFRLNVDGKYVFIPVGIATFTHYKEQFLKEKLTQPQKARLSTLKNLMRAAYIKGRQDGQTTA